MVKKTEDYKWSSYSMFLGLSKEKIINSKRILAYFNEETDRELYKKFVESAMKSENNEGVEVI